MTEDERRIIDLAVVFGEMIDGRIVFKQNKLCAFADAIKNEALSNTDEILRVIVESENYYDDLTNMLMVGCYTEAAAIFGKAASEI